MVGYIKWVGYRWVIGMLRSAHNLDETIHLLLLLCCCCYAAVARSKTAAYRRVVIYLLQFRETPEFTSKISTEITFKIGS